MPQPAHNVPGTQGGRRALSLLFCFDGRRANLTVDQLAAETDLPPASAYRYVALLKDMSILEDGSAGTYHLTSRVLALGEAFAHGHGLTLAARPMLQRLARLSGETALLVRLVDGAAVCVDRVESSQPMRLTYEPGQAVSLQQGASARVLIAGMTAGDRTAHLDLLAERDPAFAARRPRFDAEIDRTAAEGWAISHGEIDAGIVATAAPIRLGEQTIAAVSIAGPSFRVAAGALDERREAVIAAARDISAALADQASETTAPAQPGAGADPPRPSSDG